jgi:hypothetical protein
MPTPVNRTTFEGIIIDQHDVELQNKADRASSAFNLLNNYSWNGTGGMPVFTWTAPNGADFTYDGTNGELQYEGTNYTALSSLEKQGFFQYLPAFIAACMKYYDVHYNL